MSSAHDRRTQRRQNFVCTRLEIAMMRRRLAASGARLVMFQMDCQFAAGPGRTCISLKDRKTNRPAKALDGCTWSHCAFRILLSAIAGQILPNHHLVSLTTVWRRCPIIFSRHRACGVLLRVLAEPVELSQIRGTSPAKITGETLVVNSGAYVIGTAFCHVCITRMT